MKALILSAILSLCVAPAFGAEMLGEIRDVCTIEDGEGHGRVLFRWDGSSLDENASIWRALLRFELSGEQESRSIPVVIHSVTRAWDPSTVSWSSGWTRPGGDIDEEMFARGTLELSRGRATIDVTSLAKEVIEDGYVDHGYLFTVDRSEGVGFVSEDLSRVESMANPSLEISYRIVPDAPRQ